MIEFLQVVLLAFQAILYIGGNVDLGTQALNFWPRGLDAYFTRGLKAHEKQDHFRCMYLMNEKLHSRGPGC